MHDLRHRAAGARISAITFAYGPSGFLLLDAGRNIGCMAPMILERGDLTAEIAALGYFAGYQSASRTSMPSGVNAARSSWSPFVVGAGRGAPLPTCATQS